MIIFGEGTFIIPDCSILLTFSNIQHNCYLEVNQEGELLSPSLMHNNKYISETF